MDISGATLSDKAGKWPSVTKCTPVALLTGLIGRSFALFGAEPSGYEYQASHGDFSGFWSRAHERLQPKPWH